MGTLSSVTQSNLLTLGLGIMLGFWIIDRLVSYLLKVLTWGHELQFRPPSPAPVIKGVNQEGERKRPLREEWEAAFLLYGVWFSASGLIVYLATLLAQRWVSVWLVIVAGAMANVYLTCLMTLVLSSAWKKSLSRKSGGVNEKDTPFQAL